MSKLDGDQEFILYVIMPMVLLAIGIVILRLVLHD